MVELPPETFQLLKYQWREGKFDKQICNCPSDKFMTEETSMTRDSIAGGRTGLRELSCVHDRGLISRDLIDDRGSRRVVDLASIENSVGSAPTMNYSLPKVGET